MRSHTVADGLEAMSARRPYREPLRCDEISAELARGRGRQWDPALVDTAVRLMESGDIVLTRQGVQVRQG